MEARIQILTKTRSSFLQQQHLQQPLLNRKLEQVHQSFLRKNRCIYCVLWCFFRERLKSFLISKTTVGIRRTSLCRIAGRGCSLACRRRMAFCSSEKPGVTAISPLIFFQKFYYYYLSLLLLLLLCYWCFYLSFLLNCNNCCGCLNNYCWYCYNDFSFIFDFNFCFGGIFKKSLIPEIYSKAVVAYASRILTVTGLNATNIYREKYKGISATFRILKWVRAALSPEKKTHEN